MGPALPGRRAQQVLWLTGFWEARGGEGKIGRWGKGRGWGRDKSVGEMVREGGRERKGVGMVEYCK